MIVKILSPSWYKYLFKPRADKSISWFTVILCRLHNHPKGPIWFNPCGLEPDMRCSNCLDLIE